MNKELYLPISNKISHLTSIILQDDIFFLYMMNDNIPDDFRYPTMIDITLSEFNILLFNNLLLLSKK